MHIKRPMVEEVAMALANTHMHHDRRMVDFAHLSFQRIMGPHSRVGFSIRRSAQSGDRQ